MNNATGFGTKEKITEEIIKRLMRLVYAQDKRGEEKGQEEDQSERTPRETSQSSSYGKDRVSFS